MYKLGGIFSVTSRILVVDLLTGIDALIRPVISSTNTVQDLIDCTKISGVVVLHSERSAVLFPDGSRESNAVFRAIATSLEAFVIRIYRQKNKEGFIKAFSDNPEPFTTGFAPLATMMRNLFLRTPSLWPRFHVTVAKSLESKKAEVVELEVAMTDSMREIQTAVLECIEVSISELRKANTHLEIEDWTLDSALHKSFDIIVRRQLDPVWHRISWRTKQIVGDLTVLRRILQYGALPISHDESEMLNFGSCLLTYDCVTFYQHLETILATHTPPPGLTRQSQSPWLFLDAAHTIFSLAKRRVYVGKAEGKPNVSREIPAGLEPVLEELPKWSLLTEVLEEIEKEGYFNPAPDRSYGSTLIMCNDESTCRQLREYLQTMNEIPPEELEGKQDGEIPKYAAKMMRRKLKGYFSWKSDFVKFSSSLYAANQKGQNTSSGPGDQRSSGGSYRGRPPPNKRRRVRGGSSAAAAPTRGNAGAVQVTEEQSAQVAALLAGVQPTGEQGLGPDIVAETFDDLDEYYELYEMKDLVIIHPYDGDMDERLLDELRPRYVIMYEPDPAFIRRIEVTYIPARMPP